MRSLGTPGATTLQRQAAVALCQVVNVTGFVACSRDCRDSVAMRYNGLKWWWRLPRVCHLLGHSLRMCHLLGHSLRMCHLLGQLLWMKKPQIKVHYIVKGEILGNADDLFRVVVPRRDLFLGLVEDICCKHDNHICFGIGNASVKKRLGILMKTKHR